jgi:hypothetical protein
MSMCPRAPRLLGVLRVKNKPLLSKPLRGSSCLLRETKNNYTKLHEVTRRTTKLHEESV